MCIRDRAPADDVHFADGVGAGADPDHDGDVAVEGAVGGAASVDGDRADAGCGLAVESLCRSVCNPVSRVAVPGDVPVVGRPPGALAIREACLLYTSDAG